jgi:hypothetical protein
MKIRFRTAVHNAGYAALACAVILFIMNRPEIADAKTYACPQPDGSVLYTDRQAPGCQTIDLKPIVPVPRVPMKVQPSDGEIKLVPGALAPRTAGPQNNFFDTVVRDVPVLAYTGGVGPSYVPQAGEMSFHRLTLRHVGSGTGPKIKSEGVIDPSAEEGLQVAIKVAARAVGYDPAFIEVELRPRSWLLLGNSQVTPMPVIGNSASGIWTIAIASALLGDTLRSDVCMTGAISADGSISFVGKVDQKAFGCITGQHREMLVPTGQSNINVVSNVIGRGVIITEVTDVAQAYEIVTGRALRPFTPPK